MDTETEIAADGAEAKPTTNEAKLTTNEPNPEVVTEIAVTVEAPEAPEGPAAPAAPEDPEVPPKEEQEQTEPETQAVEVPVALREGADEAADEKVDEEWDKSGPQTDEEKRASRKIRLKEKVNLRFRLGESDLVVNVDPDDEQDDEVEGEITESREALPTIDDELPDLSGKQTSAQDMLDGEINVDDIFGEDDVDDDFDEPEVREPPKGDTITAKANFLSYFEMPSLSDISEEHAVEEHKAHKTKSLISQISTATDTGKFVNPLTGFEESESTSSSTESSKMDDLALDLGGESDDLDIYFMDTDFPDFKDVKHIQLREDDDLEAFVKFKSSFIRDDIVYEDPDEVEAKKQKVEIHKITMDFLYEMFNNVVNEMENLNESTILRNKMDKAKLMTTLIDVTNKYSIEKEINVYINTKMADYFKRMKNYRVFANLDPNTKAKERLRYLESLTLLDHRVLVAAETKKKNAILMSSVLMDLSYVQNISRYSEEHLEEVIMRTLANNKSDFMKRFIEREMRLMGQKRNEISDTRLFLITRKHTLGRIVDVRIEYPFTLYIYRTRSLIVSLVS